MSSGGSHQSYKSELERVHREIVTFPLTTLLSHVDICPTLDNSHDLLLCKELVNKVGSHLCTKLPSNSIKIIQLEMPMFKVGTLDSLLGNGGMERLEGCLSCCTKTLNTLIDLYLEMVEKEKKKSFNLVPIETLVQSTMDSLLTTATPSTAVDSCCQVKSNNWNYSKYPADGILTDTIELFEKELSEIEQLVHFKRELLIEAKKQASKRSPIEGVIETFNKEECSRLMSKLKDCHVEDLLDSHLFVPALLLLLPPHSEGDDKEARSRLGSQSEIMLLGPELCTSPSNLTFATVLSGKKNEFSALMQQLSINFQLIDQSLLGIIGSRSESASSLLLKDSEIATCKAAFIQSLVVGIATAVECKFHLTIVKAYYESVLQFGLPPIFLSTLITTSNSSSRSDSSVRDGEVEKYFHKFEQILESEFMIQRTEHRKTYSVIAFSITQ